MTPRHSLDGLMPLSVRKLAYCRMALTPMSVLPLANSVTLWHTIFSSAAVGKPRKVGAAQDHVTAFGLHVAHGVFMFLRLPAAVPRAEILHNYRQFAHKASYAPKNIHGSEAESAGSR